MTDKKILHISSASVLAALLIAFIAPLGESGRIIAAILLLPAAITLYLLIKKRNILSINKKMVLLIVSVIAALYVMAYYLSGLKFGFYQNPYRLTSTNLFRFLLPIATIIVSSEVIRFVVVAQNDKLANTFTYFALVIADMLVVANLPSIKTFNTFMDVIAGALFPALISNLFYNYITKRYGIYPNLVFRLFTTLHAYIFPVASGIAEPLLNFIKLLLPIAVYIFIDSLYEKKRRYALRNTSRFWRVASKILTVIVLVIIIGTVMLISNQFYFGAYVIATESMTGELNKGDIAIYESYDDQTIEEGQVIIFEKNDSVIIHRVIDIQIINGITRYYTKGDANEDSDAGYILNGDILGIVNVKLPYFGYPTIWMRGLFKR